MLLREEVVAGQPLLCPVQLQEEQTQLFQLLCTKLTQASRCLLLFSLLSGRPVHVQSDRRDEVQRCLDLVLPRPLSLTHRSSQAQAWATLTVHLPPAHLSPAQWGGEEDCQVSLSCPTCSCSQSRVGTAACPACSPASSSTIVAAWLRIIRSEQLTLTARHMRIVTTVAESAIQAKAWLRLKSPADKRSFLKKLGFSKSDGEIFDMYGSFLS
jgi:hypothetical protein